MRQITIAPRWLTLLLLASITPACARDDAAGEEQGSPHARSALPAVAYHEASLGETGDIVGTVTIDGVIPADSLVATGASAECGADMPDASLVHEARGLGNAVVWISDISQGKPRPAERRTEIVNTACRLEPRVQVVVSGTTVNVRNDDRFAHVTRFTRVGTVDSLARVPMTDDGQVVPNEHIASAPGLIAVTCGRHAFMQGWIAVLPSPYAVVTDASGGFRLDGVPPGTYTVRVWHERGREQVARRVAVTAGRAAELTIPVELR